MIYTKGGILGVLEPYVKKFFIHCFSINLQKNTIAGYEYKLKLFNEYLNATEIKSVEDITADNIRGFLFLQSKRIGKLSVLHYYNALNIFFRFLKTNKLLAENPMDLVKKPKAPKRSLRSFTNSEVNLILNYFDKNSFVGFRNYALMSMLLASGMRISEVCNLLCTDILFELDTIVVIGKGDKERHVPISPLLKKIMLRYFKKRNEYIKSKSLFQTKYFFITRSAQGMKRENVEQLFIKIKRSYNIDGKRFSAHTFRHTFAKAYLLNGGDIFSLQKILGHSKLEETQKYIEMNETEIKIQNEKFNPLDNTRWQYY